MAMRHTHAAMNHTARRSLIGVLSRGSARANVTAGARSFSAAPMVVTEHTDGALAAGTLHALKAASQLDSQVRLRRRALPPPARAPPARSRGRSLARAARPVPQSFSRCAPQVVALVAGDEAECAAISKQLSEIACVTKVRALPSCACCVGAASSMDRRRRS